MPNLFHVDQRKRLATAAARTALVGGSFVEIEGDRGEPELVLTVGPVTLRFERLDQAEHQLDRLERLHGFSRVEEA